VPKDSRLGCEGVCRILSTVRRIGLEKVWNLFTEDDAHTERKLQRLDVQCSSRRTKLTNSNQEDTQVSPKTKQNFSSIPELPNTVTSPSELVPERNSIQAFSAFFGIDRVATNFKDNLKSTDPIVFLSIICNHSLGTSVNNPEDPFSLFMRYQILQKEIPCILCSILLDAFINIVLSCSSMHPECALPTIRPVMIFARSSPNHQTGGGELQMPTRIKNVDFSCNSRIPRVKLRFLEEQDGSITFGHAILIANTDTALFEAR
jgi:hypothetical protein